jgi:hypothetical protein
MKTKSLASIDGKTDTARSIDVTTDATDDEAMSA